jgi:hypothetical protein
MTFTFESEMQDEGTMTDTISDTSNEEEEMTDEGDDQGSVDALDPALAESVRPVDLLQDVTSAMSVREWLTASVQSVGKPSLSQLTRIRELLSEPTSSPEQVEAALIDSHKQPDWLWDWCTTGLVEMHGLGLQSWWTTWESDNGYYGDNECGVKEMVKISTLMEGSADKTGEWEGDIGGRSATRSSHVDLLLAQKKTRWYTDNLCSMSHNQTR